MLRVLFWLIHLTWGLPQTIIGAFIALRYRSCAHEWYHGALVTRWPSRRGLSMGPFIFVHEINGDRAPYDLRERLRMTIVHEYGHCIQSLISGPFYLPVFAIPSIIWAGTPALRRMRYQRRLSYYSFYTERLANFFGERATGEESPGQRIQG